MQVVLKDQVDVNPSDEATIHAHLHKIVSLQLSTLYFFSEKNNYVHFLEYMTMTSWITSRMVSLIRSINFVGCL